MGSSVGGEAGTTELLHHTILRESAEPTRTAVLMCPAVYAAMGLDPEHFTFSPDSGETTKSLYPSQAALGVV